MTDVFVTDPRRAPFSGPMRQKGTRLLFRLSWPILSHSWFSFAARVALPGSEPLALRSGRMASRPPSVLRRWDRRSGASAQTHCALPQTKTFHETKREARKSNSTVRIGLFREFELITGLQALPDAACLNLRKNPNSALRIPETVRPADKGSREGDRCNER